MRSPWLFGWLALGASFSLLACAEGADPAPRDGAVAMDARAPDVVVVPDVQTRPDVPPPPAVCGDSHCTTSMGESCRTCPLDCGECPRCDMAPTCTGALAVPTSSALLASCNNTNTTGGLVTNYSCGSDLGAAPSATNCADPQLRIRLRELSIQRGFFDLSSNLYCAISAEDGMHSELLLTAPRQVAGNRMTTSLNFAPSQGLLWGQGDLYRSISNITITYACFLSSDAAAAQRVLNEISGRAAMAAAHADGYGWVFGTAAVLGTIIGASLATVRDSQVLDVQQTIAAGALLTLTNGRNWVIRGQHGNLDLSGAWDLRLTLESWGCADARMRAP